MKKKTSITIWQNILAQIDRMAGANRSRSAMSNRFSAFLRERVKTDTQARDLERLNAVADRLNAEAADVLEYQFRED